MPACLPRPDQGSQWSVIHCRPRCEKKVAEYCRGKAMHAYLPVLTKKHRYGGRVRIHEVPVFSGYVFVLADAAGRNHLRQNQRVVQVLEVIDQQTLILQLDNIKTALDNHLPSQLLPRLATGMKVKVQAGPLKGVEGYIEKIKNSSRIVMNIDFIQQALAVEVDAGWLLPI